jgi:4-amino-4-deoxy-L-arabinose transferase-like glycosyltransferase
MSSHNGTAVGGNRKANYILLLFAAFYFFLVLIPGIVRSYGYFIDEFYYLACANHISLGYVDHPPLSIYLLWGVRALIGDSLPALRIIPALAGALTIFLIGIIARRLGANAFGQALAAGAAMTALVYQALFSFYSMNALSILLWAVSFLILIEIEKRGNQRLWLLFGIVAGIGLENKHTFILLPIGLAVGLLLTRARRHLKSPWLWAGALIAVVLVLPNLGWQVANGWPSIEFYRNADLYKNVSTPPLEVLLMQVLVMNPGALPVWLAGIVFFMFTKRGRDFRHLGWIFITLFALMLIAQKSRPDRIAEAYIIVLAGGGVVLGDLCLRRGLRWLRFALPALIMITGAALVPLGLTILPPETTSRYAAAFGLVPQIEKGEGKRTELPQWMSDRMNWESYVDDVIRAAATLTPEERNRAAILVPTYGQAGALELLGGDNDLPPVYAAQNNYHLWGPPGDDVEVLIITGPLSSEGFEDLFGDVRLVGVHECVWCTPWRDGIRIWIARDLKISLTEFWPEFRFYE